MDNINYLYENNFMKKFSSVMFCITSVILSGCHGVGTTSSGGASVLNEKSVIKSSQTTASTSATLKSWQPLAGTALQPQISPGSAAYLSSTTYQGTKYVAFQDGATPGNSSGNSLSVMVLPPNSSHWDYLGIPGFATAYYHGSLNIGGVTFSSIAVDPTNGTPYVAYSDPLNSGKLSVMKYTGAVWVQVNKNSFGVSNGSASYISLTIAPDGTKYIAFQDNVSDLKGHARVYRLLPNDDTNSWYDIGSIGVSAGNASYEKIVVDKSNAPYVAFCDTGTNADGLCRLRVLRWNPNVSPEQWVEADKNYTPQLSSSIVYNVDLRLDNNGTPYVAYNNANNRISIRSLNNNQWLFLPGDIIGVGPNIVFDNKNNLYLSVRPVQPDSGISVFGSSVFKYYPNTSGGGTWVAVGPSRSLLN